MDQQNWFQFKVALPCVEADFVQHQKPRKHGSNYRFVFHNKGKEKVVKHVEDFLPGSLFHTLQYLLYANRQ